MREISEEKIPHYVNDPIINAMTAPELKLKRPKINYLEAILFVLAMLGGAYLISFIISILVQLINNRLLELKRIFVYANSMYIWSLIVVVLCMSRFICIWFVRLYQRYARSETRLRCCYIPSCSEYAILSFKKYGVFWGGIKTVKRLLRCHPPGGVDYP